MNIGHGSDVVLMFRPDLPLHHLTPVMTLTTLLSACNRQLDSGNEVTNDMMKLLRVNLFATEFQQGRQIIKPIHAELENFNLVVARGDTRLMAAELVESVTHAPVLCLVPKAWRLMFAKWIEIDSWDHLTDRLGFPRGCVKVSFDRTNANTEISFLEFAIPQTAHHLHDESQRQRMMANYLSQQDPEFRFSKNWIQQPIEWSRFDC